MKMVGLKDEPKVDWKGVSLAELLVVWMAASLDIRKVLG